MSEIRVLAVRQRYASSIIEGLKTIEVRSRPTNIRERVAIYASNAKQEPLEGVYGPDYNYRILPTGKILGTVEIVASSHASEIEYELYKNEHLAPSKYFREGKTFFWHLRRPIKFETPIPIKWPSTGSWAKTELPEFYPKRDCTHFDEYLGVCKHPDRTWMACRERICPLINRAF